jgi:hypothetical protein
VPFLVARGAKTGLNTKNFDRCMTNVIRNPVRRLIHMQFVMQLFLAKQGIKGNSIRGYSYWVKCPMISFPAYSLYLLMQVLRKQLIVIQIYLVGWPINVRICRASHFNLKLILKNLYNRLKKRVFAAEQKLFFLIILSVFLGDWKPDFVSIKAFDQTFW